MGDSYSEIKRKPDGSLELQYGSPWSEAFYEIPADAVPKLAAALGTSEAHIASGWARQLRSALPHEYIAWLDQHGIPYRTVFVWSDWQ
ncbi:hypothetical protein [Microbacterium sp.]|uniref:hypothetical protein n=1 Tax=Microbacterium sp. TaxID=51671 RepID=UPI0037C98C23